MEFVILGPTTLTDDGEEIPLGAAKQRGLLSLLLLYAGEPVKVDMLVGCLWRGGNRASQRRAIYSLISRSRAAFLRHRLPVTVELIRSAQAYRLQVNPLAVDLHRFRAGVLRARSEIREERHETAVATLQKATALWVEPIPDVRGTRSAALREKLTEEFLIARKMLAESLIRTGRQSEALPLLERLLYDNTLDAALARM